MNQPSSAAMRAAKPGHEWKWRGAYSDECIHCGTVRVAGINGRQKDKEECPARVAIDRETGIAEYERKRILSELETLESMGDIEMAHIMADDQLKSLLKRLGYEDVVEAYDRIPKWFA